MPGVLVAPASCGPNSGPSTAPPLPPASSHTRLIAPTPRRLSTRRQGGQAAGGGGRLWARARPRPRRPRRPLPLRGGGAGGGAAPVPARRHGGARVQAGHGAGRGGGAGRHRAAGAGRPAGQRSGPLGRQLPPAAAPRPHGCPTPARPRACLRACLRACTPAYLPTPPATPTLPPHRQVNLYALHRSERWWRDPDAFVPERFLAGSPEAAEARRWGPAGGCCRCWKLD